MSGLEVLGAVLACMTCVAQVSMNVTSYAKQIQHAPQAFDEFQQELSHFDELLRQTKEVLIKSGRGDTVKEDASAVKMLEGCANSLKRIKQDFPAATDEITLRKRISLVLNKETFTASRTHVQAVSQTLVLFLQKVALAETLTIADAQDEMLKSQEKTQSEITKLGSIMTDMLKKLTSLERHSNSLDLKSQSLTPADMADPELGEIDKVVEETSAGARHIRSYYDAALAFQQAMQERLRNPPGDSETGSLSAKITKWAVGVPAEDANIEEDSAVDVQSPELSKYSSEPCIEMDDDEFDENAEHQDPNILIHEIDFFQNQVKRQVAVSAFSDAKKNMRHSIALSEKLETLHDQPFKERVDWMLRLAHITMEEGKPRSFEEARDVLNRVKRLVNGENVVMIAELDHFRALTYLEESKASCADDVRPLPDQNVALLGRAEACAIKALQGRKTLAGPPRELIRDSVKLLMSLYDRLDRPEKKYAYGKEYRAFLDTHDAPVDLQQQAKNEVLGQRPLSVSEEHNFTDEERWLLQRGFELRSIDFINAPHEKTNITPLITAICENNPDADDMARRFIRSLHADVNRVDSMEDSGISPLMWAIKLKNHAMMQILINARADVTFCDKRGRTMMHAAVEAASTRILLELFKQKPDLIDRTDNAAQTPLHKAVDLGSLKEAKFLLNRSADVNAQDSDGQTPSHLAVLISSEEIVKYLLVHKPSLWIKNNDRRTVLEESRKVNGWNSRIYATLQQYDANSTGSSQQRRRTTSSATAQSGVIRVPSHVSTVQPVASAPASEPKGSKWPKFLKK